MSNVNAPHVFCIKLAIMVRTAFSLIGLVLCTLLCAATTRAQEIPPRLYLFVELADASGEAVVDATVRVSNADGKELLNLKTSKNGVVKEIFERSQPAHHYDLQITKTGYVPYESVLFPSVLTERYFAIIRLTEEIPSTPEPSNYSNGPPIKITLRQTPATPSEAKKQQLLFAAKRGDASSLRKLLQDGVDANSVDAKGVPAVAWATFAGDPETIKLLLDAGANVRNEKSLAHEALLIYLAEGMSRNRLQTEVIATLINAGAGVNATNNNGESALIFAIKSYVPDEQKIEIVRLLLRGGADVSSKNKEGKTPIGLARELGQAAIVKLIEESQSRP